MWVLPEEVGPGAQVGLAFAWFPHPQVEYNDLCHWYDGEAAPAHPQDHLYGEWRPSPCYESFQMMRNYRVIPAVAALFHDGNYICFYARGKDWWVPKGTPRIIMLFDEGPLHAPHEPPAYLR